MKPLHPGQPMEEDGTSPSGRYRRRSRLRASTPALGLTALGVVFGDIGTSPLYTLKTVFALTGGHPSPEVSSASSRW